MIKANRIMRIVCENAAVKENVKKILIVKTSSLGDVVHGLPMINDILRHVGEAHIDWVVEASFADIPRLHPQVKDIFTMAVRRWRKHILSRNTWAEISEFKQLIKQNQYDAIIDAQGLLKSALITKQARGEKHGYDANSIREPIASWFYDVKHAISYDQHAVNRNRTLASMSLGYPIPTDAPDYGIQAPTIDLQLPEKFAIGLHGTSRDSKLWPLDHWISLGHSLAQEGLVMALPWGSEAERQRAQAICDKVDNALMLPKLNIHALAGVIGKSRCAVGVDTGLSHLAVALGKPTVAIYTDTDPARTGVQAGNTAKALNLGGVHQNPSVDAVMQSLRAII